ncbi:polyprenyl synthetase family protein [Streptomyces sp. NPDC051130]|uniref:polyprenyl synthetase family protein n=1 Tax=Streptomyces sp. NPDC051130 TaxID=3157223 RepID=UPI00342D2AB5
MTTAEAPAPFPGPGLTHPGVAQAQELLPPFLRRWVARLGSELGRICGYQLGLWDVRGDPAGGHGGKLIRPAFTLLCSAATGGGAAEVLPAAAGIELLHNASLIHDDIMDGDRSRRHRPTAWVRFGVPRALLAGDALIALGFEVLAAQRQPTTPAAVAELAGTLRRLAIGQDGDLRFEREGVRNIGIDECLEMLAGKTGALLGSACRMGVHHAATPPGWADAFDRFGSHLGVAFQLVDDVLGIWGDPAVTGKPVGSDIRARKKSAPVVAALRSGTAASARLLPWYDCANRLTDDQVAVVAELIEEAGGRKWALAEADRRLTAAWDSLDGLDLDPAGRRGLVDLATTLTTRRH